MCNINNIVLFYFVLSCVTFFTYYNQTWGLNTPHPGHQFDCSAGLSGLWHKRDTTVMQQWYNSDTIVMQQWYNCDATVIQQWYNSDTIVIQQWYNSDTTVIQQWYNCDTIVMRVSESSAVLETWLVISGERTIYYAYHWCITITN